MPSSVIDALLSGSVPTDEDKLNAMSDTLRKNKQAADLFSLSTIKPISQAAVRSGEDMMTAAKRIGTLREARQRREEAARLREMELAQEQARQAVEDEKWRREYQQKEELARQARESKEKLAALKAATPKPTVAKPNLTQLDKIGASLKQTGDFLSLFSEATDPEDPTKLSSGGGYIGAAVMDAKDKINLPFLGLGLDDEGKRTMDWWGDYKRFFETVDRLGFYGTQFPKNEQEEWKGMSIDKRFEEGRIRNRLARMREFIRYKTKTKFEQLKAAGMTEEQLRGMSGDGVYDFAYASPQPIPRYEGEPDTISFLAGDKKKKTESTGQPPVGLAKAKEAQKTKQQPAATPKEQPVSPELDEANKAVMAKTGKTIDQLKALADTDQKAFIELMKNNEDLWGYFQ